MNHSTNRHLLWSEFHAKSIILDEAPYKICIPVILRVVSQHAGNNNNHHSIYSASGSFKGVEVKLSNFAIWKCGTPD